MLFSSVLNASISSLQSDLIDAAVTAIKARLDERDGNIRSVWLLTE